MFSLTSYGLSSKILFIGAHIVPWLLPDVSISLGNKTPPLTEIELPGKPLYDTDKNVDDTLIPAHETFSDKWQPHLVIEPPTFNHIVGKAATSLVIDLPLYTLKSLYNNPYATILFLYLSIPAPVLKILFPKLIKYMLLA